MWIPGWHIRLEDIGKICDADCSFIRLYLQIEQTMAGFLVSCLP